MTAASLKCPTVTPSKWAFDNFKEKAVAAGGVISDELLAEFKDEVADAIRHSNDDIDMMGGNLDKPRTT